MMSASDPKRTFAPAPFSGVALFVAASASTALRDEERSCDSHVADDFRPDGRVVDLRLAA